MSKLEKQLTHRLEVFLYRKEETRKVSPSPALSVERVCQARRISMFT